MSRGRVKVGKHEQRIDTTAECKAVISMHDAASKRTAGGKKHAAYGMLTVQQGGRAAGATADAPADKLARPAPGVLAEAPG